MIITDEYIRGLIDGEGSFIIAFSNQKYTRFGKRPRCYLIIRMSKLAIKTLIGIRDYLNCGHIYKHKRHGKEKMDTCDFRVGGYKELKETIIPLLDRHTPIIKKKDYLVWREAVLLMYGKEHLKKEGYIKLINLRECLNVFTKHSLRKEIICPI